MGIPILIIGKSGAGKSTSLRNCKKNFAMVKVLNKPLPFKGKIPTIVTDDYDKIKNGLRNKQFPSMVIDDAGYLITNHFMSKHSTAGAGNAVFSLYNALGDHYWSLIQFIINDLPMDKIVYIMMHEDVNEFGDIKPKTIGKLLDEKVCIEGMFTIVLRCVVENGVHKFITQSDGGAVSKSPIGMFDTLEIDNDLQMVDDVIREYYEIPIKEEKENAETK